MGAEIVAALSLERTYAGTRRWIYGERRSVIPTLRLRDIPTQALTFARPHFAVFVTKLERPIEIYCPARWPRREELEFRWMAW